MKNRELFSFFVLYLSSVAILALVVSFWHESVGWSHLLWLFGTLFALSVLFGYLFAKYLLEPLAHRNRELDKLLQDTLHELNIPLATIYANLQMMQKKGCTQKRLDRIKRALEQLKALYEEVEYLIKKEIDTVTKEPVRLDRLIMERVELFEDMLRGREIFLDLEPVEVATAKRGFAKMFDNLLFNAIKYSPPKSPIKIVLTKSALIIEDSGKGIEEKELLRIFERYYQSDKGSSGYGIGLAIVKEFCDEAGIGIRIESKVGKGTRVILDLTHM